MRNDKMVNGKKGRYIFTLCFVALFFILGCRSPFEPPQKNTLPEGKGYFTLTLGGAERTIMPQEIRDRWYFDSYALEFSLVGVDTIPSVRYDLTYYELSDPITLEAGTWNLRVGACMNNGQGEGVGYLEGIVIAVGETVTGIVTLSPAPISGYGEGTFSWSIVYNNSLNNSGASMIITPLDVNTGTPEVKLNFTGYSSTATGSIELNVGYYCVVFTRNGNDEWSETLHIYPDMISQFTHSFVTYTVTFDTGYYGSYVSSQTVSSGEMVIRPPYNPTRSGYGFIGWSTSYYNNYPYDFNTPVTYDTTLYAQWVELLTEGIHVRIISFGGESSYLSNLTLLDQYGSGRSSLNSSLYRYTIASQPGTALFYSVHKALEDLKTNEVSYPANLDEVSIITFTDGLDNQSSGLSAYNPIEDRDFDTEAEYADYVSGEIRNRRIANKPITAYSIGIRGNDVTDVSKFESDLKKIASPDKDYVFSDFAQVQEIFDNIANSLNFISSMDYTMVTTLLGNGTRVRMTFDVDGIRPEDAIQSTRYIEGTISRSGSGASLTYTLTNILYGSGISSNAGSGPITGSSTNGGLNQAFVFNNLVGYYPTDRARTKQWTMPSNSSTWQYSSEYSTEGSTNYERRSAIIYLILDASTSMSSGQIYQIRTAAENFIYSLQNRYWSD
jgi:uncharacterized repeat protein (TIGR02543 family)